MKQCSYLFGVLLDIQERETDELMFSSESMAHSNDAGRSP